MDTSKLLVILVEGGSFIAAFAGIAAGAIMASVTRKFGTGILASGFKAIAIGVLLIALGIIVDAVQTYVLLGNNFAFPILLLLIKEVLFVAGTYIIVIGSKKTGDKLESLTQ